LTARDGVHDRSFGAFDRLFRRTPVPRDDGPCGRLLDGDLDLSCARHRRCLHIRYRDEPNGDLPQAGCPPLLQQWSLCIEAGRSLVVAAHIFHQSKQCRPARRVYVTLHAGLSEAAARDVADLD
jgi:hypothetical protein